MAYSVHTLFLAADFVLLCYVTSYILVIHDRQQKPLETDATNGTQTDRSSASADSPAQEKPSTEPVGDSSSRDNKQAGRILFNMIRERLRAAAQGITSAEGRIIINRFIDILFPV